MKTCIMCNKEKPRQEFYDNITCADGYSAKCKKCCRKMNHLYYLQRKEKKKETLLPFIYHPRTLRATAVETEPLKVEHGPIRIDFE
jgi:hypothetical protein